MPGNYFVILTIMAPTGTSPISKALQASLIASIIKGFSIHLTFTFYILMLSFSALFGHPEYMKAILLPNIVD